MAYDSPAGAPMRGAALSRGREAYDRRAWRDAYEELRAGAADAPLEPADIHRLAVTAHLTGHDAASVEAFEQAFQAYLALGEVERAVRCGFWLGINLVQRGQHAQGGGWLARCRRLLEEGSLDCVERGYLLVPVALQALQGGDPKAAYATFGEAMSLADRFGDPDLVALSRLGRGRALIAMGDALQGVDLLDEAMLAVTTGDVSPMAAGIVYCALIISCRQIFDLRRAQEWTVTLTRWCAAQQDLRPYRGQCLIHRSEIMQLRGEWSEAMEEVQQACAHLSGRDDPVLGMARYQQGELLRLRGQFARAEGCYRQASEWGHPVQPGLALLRLAQGRVDDAAAAIRRVTDEAADDKVTRSRVLAAYVEISLAIGDVEAARAGADELEALAEELDAPYLRAMAAYARGAVMLADGDLRAACRAMRRADTGWRELDAPYEAARARLLMSHACRRLADHDTADVELEAARRAFERLGAAPALAQIEALAGRRRAPSRAPGGLTPREVEVLVLVATGATNKQVADALVISERTVARHLNNTFVKLGISSRAAATAYAYEHHLV